MSISESKFFEDFDDDFEDDYTESIELIEEFERLHSEYQANIQSREQCTVNPNDLERLKKSLECQQSPSFVPFTRYVTNQQQDNADILVKKDNNQISFEALMEDEKNETSDEVEYFLADSDYDPNETDAESTKSDSFGAETSNPTCYELNDQTNSDSKELEESKQNIGIGPIICKLKSIALN